ncbi:MAG TPA: hypothetical protein VIH37_13700, partial [Candidatus Limnocylindrales bacterium]
KRGRVSPELAAAIARADLTWTGRRPEARVAELAADVLRAAEAGDPYPLRIVDRWCGRVTRAVREESADLALGESPAVVVYGGLVGQSPWLEARIVQAVLAGAPGARPTHLTAEPVEGAALLARDAWAGRLGPWAFTPLR